MERNYYCFHACRRFKRKNVDRLYNSNKTTFFVSNVSFLSADDVVGGSEVFEKGLKQMVHRMAQRYEEENGESFFITDAAGNDNGSSATGAPSTAQTVGSGPNRDGE